MSPSFLSSMMPVVVASRRRVAAASFQKLRKRSGRCVSSAASSSSPAQQEHQRENFVGPYVPENPTVEPGGRVFDLGPFAFYRVPENVEPMRLELWVAKNVCSNWNVNQKLFRTKQVWVMSAEHSTDQHRASVMFARFRPACNGSIRLQPHDYVYFPKIMQPKPSVRASTEAGNEPAGWLLSRLLYKDTDFLAINKPSGWAVQPGKRVGEAHLQRLLSCLQFGFDEPPRLIHRLSTELSGVLLLARHPAAASFAKDMVQRRAFWQRGFWGIVCGRLDKPIGTISIPLANERRGNKEVAKMRREDDGGLSAFTEYRSLRSSPVAGGFSLVEFNPYSGRHHQVRAHCAYGLRAPLVGDPIYYSLSNHLNAETAHRVQYYSEELKQERKQVVGSQPRLHLHSRQLMIKTFAGKEIVITAPLPDHMTTSFKNLGWSEFLRQHEKQAARLNPWSAETDPHVIEALANLRASNHSHEATDDR